MEKENKNPNPNRPYYIILSILAVLIVGLGIADTILALSPKAKSPNPPAATHKNISEFTKEDAEEFLNNSRNNPDYVPDGFIDSALLPEGATRYFILEYSYENLEDIKETDYHISDFGKYELAYNEVDGKYAVVTAIENGQLKAGSQIGISFNKNYLDHHQVRETAEGGYTNVYDVMVVNDTSDDFLKTALPILYLSSGYFTPSINSIYDYEFTEEGNDIILKTTNIGVGLDLNSYSTTATTAESLPYAINIYTTSCKIDKTTGKFEWIKNENDEKTTIVRSFSISYDEALQYMKY